MDPPTEFQVKRKPIPRSATEQVRHDGDLRGRSRVIPDRRAQSAGPSRRVGLRAPQDKESPPPLPPRSRSPGIVNASAGGLLAPSHNPGLRRVASAVTLGGPVSSSEANAPYSDPPPPYSAAHTFPTASTPTASGPSFAQTALSSARDFAARFKPLPTTTTKHYTIALHSSPLVLYHGPTTSISVTIFTSSAALLPPDRTLWLQRRGFSGDTGSRLKTLVGATSGRIDVTPTQRFPSTSVDAAQERSWARDITRVGARLERRGGGGVTHLPRETHVVRIPGSAGDGYFRVLVIGGGKRPKVLCSSPVFRVASASADASVMRGASLLTLPLEVGVKVASTMATVTAAKVVGPAVAAAQVVGGRAKKYQPGLDAARAVYGASGLGDKVNALEGRYAQARETDYSAFQVEGAVDDSLDVVGPDEGPEKPYPLKFQGKVVRGTGNGGAVLGVPTANLGDVPEDVKLRLKGVYCGWACIVPKPGLEGLSHDWHEAMISAGPSPYASATVLAKTTITVHMIYDFEHAFYDAKVQVIVMGFLRPMKPVEASPEEVLDAVSQDVWLTMASLSRENWGPHTTLDTIKAAKTARTFSDKYVGAREKVQRHVERIPAHWAGIRTTGAELRDKAHGNGGYWIAR